MFRFFPPEADEVEKSEEGQTSDKERSSKELRRCEEIQLKQLHYDIPQKVPLTSLAHHDALQLKHIRVADLLTSGLFRDDKKTLEILMSTSDLVPGEYEGGFKIWECTFDLIKFLKVNVEIGGPSVRVLDLGCGSGILGLYALALGTHVVFQDYNVEVLNYQTIPNTIANFGDEGLSRCRYYAGDWSSFEEIIKVQRSSPSSSSPGSDLMFDLILTSETIYNEEYLPRFLSLIRCCLKRTGSLFLAAKSCYFGVGGGTKAFRDLVAKDSALEVTTVDVIREGIQREILRVRFMDLADET